MESTRIRFRNFLSQLRVQELAPVGLLLLLCMTAGCAGGESAAPLHPVIVTVTTTPAAATVFLGATQTFWANIIGTNNTAVAWTIQEGVAGGSITSAGIYTAPQVAGTYHVIATSVADATKSGSAIITVPPVTVMVLPPTATMRLGVVQTFMASVTATNGSVTWSIQEGSTGGSITNAGIYTAPQVAGTYHVIATSVTDTSKVGGATINVIPPGQIMITSVPPNGVVGIPYGVPVQLCSGGTLQNLFELSASGGRLGRGGAYAWTGSSLPPGLQVYNITLPGFPTCAGGSFGAIEGTPAAAGTYTFSLSVRDTETPPATATQQYTIEINSPPAATLEKVPADQARETHHHYKLIDVGTFGGRASQYSVPSSAGLNNRGTATGVADTSIPDPNCFFDCFVDHAFVSKEGVTTDLGTLPGGASSFAYTVNEHGLIVGQSQNGSIDPHTGLPEVRGVLWRNGQIIDLGTLGGNASNANAINDRGQVVGAATNATFDPFGNVPQAPCHVLTSGLLPSCSVFTFAANSLFSPSTTETHAFLWENGFMRDLGTLGGPDSSALINNDHGEVAGWSYTSFVANPSTGVPTVDPFLWDPEDAKLVDLGSLGGTFGAPFFMNNRGQVIGVSNLPGDLIVHPFIWSKSEGMKDLGTLGGTYGHPNWINDEGEVVGFAQFAGDQTGHAFLWRNGEMTDLGTIGTDPASEAGSINSRHQIVGGTFIFGGSDLHGWLWENGGPIVDLDTLILPGSGLTVFAGNLINDRGEIAGRGRLPNGDEHAILLIPCDENHPDIADCDYDTVTAETAAQFNPAPITRAPAPSPAKLFPTEIMMTRFQSFGTGRNRRDGTPQTSSQ